MTTRPDSITTPDGRDTGDLDPGVETAAVVLGGRRLILAVADDPLERSQGLRRVDDLGDLDGMLFRWEEEVTAAFTMQDTPIPLDIAFFSADGELVDRLEMVPCTTRPCPPYDASGPFAYAIEVPAGGFADLEPSARLVFDGG